MPENICQDLDAEFLLNTLLRETPDIGLVTWDAQGEITYLSDRCRELLRLPASAAAGDSIRVLAKSPCRTILQVYDRFREASDGSPIEQAYELECDGGSCRLQLSLRRMPQADRDDAAFLLIVRDAVTARDSVDTEPAAAPDGLLQKTLLLDSIFRQLPFALCVVDTERRIIQTSDATLALFGYQQEQMANHTTRMIYPTDEEYERVGRVIYKDNPGGTLVAELVDAKGRLFQGQIQVAPLYDPGQVLCGYLVAVEDVTARMAYEEELRRYEQIVSASGDALVFIDLDHIYRAANDAYLSLWHKQREEIIGKRIADVVGEEFYLEFSRPALERCFAGESVFFEAIEVNYPIGRRFVDAQHTPYYGKQGEIAGVLITLRDVTQRYSAEMAMHESEQRFRAIFDHVPIGVVILDVRDGKILDANSACLRMYGYDRDEYLNLKPWELVVGITPKNFATQWRRVTKRRRSRFEWEHWRKSGKRIHVLVDASRVELAGRTVIISTLVDISHQKKLEQRLREQQNQYRMLVESSNAILFTADPEAFRFNFVSPEAENLLGYPVSDWLRKPGFWIDRLHPEDREWAPEYCRSMVTQKQDHAFDYRMIAADGRVVWLHDVTSVILQEGKVISLVGVMVDITFSKEAEAERRRLSEIVEQSTDAVLLTDTEFKVTYLNEAFTRLYGYSLADLKGKRPDMLNAEPDAVNIMPEIYAQLEAGQRIYRQLLNRRKDGTTFHCQHSITPMLNDHGEAIAYMSSQRDVSLQMEAVQALRESEEKYRQIVETAHEGMWVLDADTLTTFVNPRLAEMLGYAQEEMQDRPLFEFMDEAGQEQARKAWERLRQQAKMVVDLLFRRQDGSDLWCHVSASIISGGENGFIGALALLTDITEQRQLTEALIRSQKMEAVGQLTGGIAHDFNNILGSILGFTELSQNRFGKVNPKLREYLTQIEIAGVRARDLIRQLLIFSRGENTQAASSIPLSPLVKEIMKMLRPMLPAVIELRSELPQASPFVKVDPLHVQQLLMNLCINARDAIEGSGLITIQVMGRKLVGDRCAICGESISGDWVSIQVADTGHGIAESLREDIFQPFITSKGVGEGSGMGLAVVRGIINSYSGHLLVESAPGRGAVFEILLPETLPEPDRDETSDASKDSVIRLTDLTILAVDDEPQFRAYFEEMLSDAGAKVICCQNGVQALGRYQRDGANIDLIISDQSMPGMSGLEMVEHLRSLGSQTPIILCSGYGYAVDEIMMRELQVKELLHKPISRGELLAAIKRVLAM